MDDNFDGYTTKVLNDEETGIFKQSLIDSGYFKNIIQNLKKIPMLYMPNIIITEETLKENKKTIYYLSDDNHYDYFVNRKLPLKTFYNRNFKFFGFTKAHRYSCTQFILNHNNPDTYVSIQKFSHVLDAFEKRLKQTFMLINYIFITDIAKYLFLMYYDVAFG